MDDIFNFAYSRNALGVYLSGAGPTIVAIVHKDNNMFEFEMKKILEKKFRNWNLYMLSADNCGAVVVEK